MKPWKVVSWLIRSQQNSRFVAQMEQVLDVYKCPYNVDYPVVCMDESPKQLIKETRMPISMKPSCDANIDFEYGRFGVANIFIASEPLNGKRFVEVTEQRTKIDWVMFVKKIADEWYKKEKKIILVMDNLATNTASALYEAFEPSEAKRIWDRFEFIYTPKHGSWLNMAEIELNVQNGQCLNRRMDKIDMIKEEVKAWANCRNNKQSVINWQFKTADARIKLKRLYPTIIN